MKRVRVAVAVSLVVGLGAVALLVFVAPSVLPLGGGGGPAGSARPPNVVVICLDTLRADSLSLYGGAGRTPALDRFAATAAAFLDASSSSAWTAPSVTTLLTGLLPSRHGVQGAADISRSGRGKPPPLARHRTLAEAFRGAGYVTAAVTAGAWVAPERGLARGFDTFSVAFDVAGPEGPISAWAAHRAADRPFFLFLHTYAAHAPYGRKPPSSLLPSTEAAALSAWAERVAPPGPDDGRTPPDDEMRRFALAYVGDVASRKALDERLRPETMRRLLNQYWVWADGPYTKAPWRTDLEASLRAAYLDGVSFADEVFARTVRVVEGLSRAEDTVVVVVADHGEGFGEHAALGHGRHLYEELVRVPFLVRAPGRLAPGTVKGSCGIIDALPTAMDLAGVAPVARIDGRSVAPMARGNGVGRPIVGEEQRLRLFDDVEEVVGLTSVRTEDAKYVRTTDAGGRVVDEELYDLAADPGEKVRLDVKQVPRFGAAFANAVDAVRHAAPGGG